MSTIIQRAMLSALAAICILALLASGQPALLAADPECDTYVKKLAPGVYSMACPYPASCEDPEACDADYQQVGNNYYHYCRCIDVGGGPAACGGFMKSTSSDPLENGFDVGCFSPGSCDHPDEVCNPVQLQQGSDYVELCTCR